MPPLRDDERYDPMPGLLQLPAHLLRQLGPRARRRALIAIVVTLVVGIGAAVALAPKIDESKKRDAAAEREHLEQIRADRIARLRAEVKPHHGRAPEHAARGLSGAAALPNRRALVGDLEQAVLADARSRAALALPVEAVSCQRFPRRPGNAPGPEAELGVAKGRYECLAVTSRIESDTIKSYGLIGYPFRALAHFETGAFAWCKISGRPGEGAMHGQPLVRVPRSCGGG
jgi:hypothetical protein